MTDPVPTSRHYTHQHCQTQTEVSGARFATVSNPLAGVKEIRCDQCGDKYPIEDFTWSDTGESIELYYKRNSKKGSEMDTFFCSDPGMFFLIGLGFFLGVMFGAMICFVMRSSVAVVLAILLGLAGAAAGAYIRQKILVPGIIQRVCGVSDTRLLQ